MKNLYILIAVFLLKAASSFSQESSTFYLRDTDFSILKTHTVILQSTGEKKQITESTDFEDVRSLTFLQNDSLALTTETGSGVYTRLADIDKVSKYKKRFSSFLGITLGALGGGILGGVIGWAAYGNNLVSEGTLYSPFVSGFGNKMGKIGGAIAGALIGVLGGGVLGAVITNGINQMSIDLFSVPDKDKKSELIKFLRQK